MSLIYYYVSCWEKGPGDHWKDLGPWVKLCRLATDWGGHIRPIRPLLSVTSSSRRVTLHRRPGSFHGHHGTGMSLTPLTHSLRKEAVEGMQPVFDSPLAAGVIVPCPNSPVNSPIPPVKKYRPPPATDEWRFVQDFAAVNLVHP